jgi:RND family efflux transporter MFP subunit
MFRNAILVLAVLAGLAGCRAESRTTAEDIRPVRAQRVGAQVGSVSANYSGEIRARHETQLGFMIAGRIQRRLVEVGDVVKVGTPLFQLDPSDAALNANASRSQVESARSQLRQAQGDYQRYANLAKGAYVSRADLDKVRMSLETAQQAVRAAEANYGVAANQAGYTTLRATAAGVVTQIDAEAGQVMQAGQPVVHIAADGERDLVVSVPESRIDELRTAQALKIELWAAPDHHYNGRLRELAPDADSVTRTYEAKVTLVDADPNVRLGMTGKLFVLMPALGRGLRRLPLTAIYDANGRPTVWVVDPKTSRVANRPVRLAQAQKDGVLVSEGLRDGDIVVTAGVNLLHAGQKVRLTGQNAEVRS